MWAMTNPTSTTPVTAITTFLPTVVPHSATTGLVGQNRRACAAPVRPGKVTGFSLIACTIITTLDDKRAG